MKMKTRLSFFLLILIALFLALCQKENNIEKPPKLTYVETKPGGCNDHFSVQNKSILLKNDSVGISNQNDSIRIFIGINYICCAPFEAVQEIKNDSIFISIKDTCPYPTKNCYCRCMCYYTWDFRFVQSGQGSWHYKIILFDPSEQKSKVIQQGTID